jgi:RNA polymerase sigma-70 factor (ECF subfamily)
MSARVTAELLLGHGEFLRELALCLARDRAQAEDLVQDTYVAALRSPPGDLGRPLRPWLGQILRNVFRSTLRRASRRRTRERQAVALEGSRLRADDTLAQMQLQREIVGLLTALDEPYRTTLVLRFYEGKDAPEIGRAMGTAAATVRWRLSEGLERIRTGLDARHRGERSRWRALLPGAPGVGARRGTPAPIRPVTPLKLTGGLVAGALALSGVATWWMAARHARPAASPSPAVTARTVPARGNSPHPYPEDPSMLDKQRTLARATAFFTLALPALVAGAENGPQRMLRDERIDSCMEIHQQIFACDQEFADLFVKDVPAERRSAARRKVLADIARDGTGPEGPRREACAASVDKGPPPTPEQVKLFGSVLGDCRAKSDCKARAACLWPIVAALRARR